MMLRKVRRRVVCACVGVLLPAGVFATDVASTSITTPTTWALADGPFIVKGDVLVNNTLTIEPGVQVLFDGPYAISVNTGKLIAQGTAQNNIVFSANGNAAVAAKLNFANDGVDATFDTNGNYQAGSGSILEYVVVEKIGSANTGGAIVLSGARPYIHNSIVRNNGARGIYAFDIDGALRIINNTIEFNSGSSGAGLYILGKTGTTQDVVVVGNTIQSNAAIADGGGLYISSTGTLTLTDNVVTNNQAGVNGGGAYVYGNSALTASLQRNTYSNNYAATSGGGIYMSDLALTASAEKIAHNQSPSTGAGLFMNNLQATFAASMIMDNKTVILTGANCPAGFDPCGGANGGGIYLQIGNYTFTDTVLALNESGLSHGGAIDMHGMTATNVSIDHSVVAANRSAMYGSGLAYTEATGAVTNSAIVLNKSPNPIMLFQTVNLQGNTIAQNENASGGTISIGSTATPTLLDNNIFANVTPYDVFNGFDGTITAKPNWWGTVDRVVISQRISLASDKPQATVDWDPPSMSLNVNAPITPPTGVAMVTTPTSIKVNWSANTESDTMGYKVYWGTKPIPAFEHFAYVTGASNFEIQNIPSGNYYVAVTAYDTGYVAANDDPVTPVNENQTHGNESWYGGYKKLSIVESDIAVAATLESNTCTNGLCITGDLIRYHVTLSNNGPSDSQSLITVTSSVPAGLAVQKLNDGTPILTKDCQLINNDQVVCTRPALALNAADSFDISMQVTETGSKEISNTIQVSTQDPDPNSANNTTTVKLTANPVDLSVAWTSAPTKAALDENLTYDISVSNAGPVAASDVMVEIAVPVNMTVDAPSCTLSVPGVLTCSVGPVAKNGSTSMQFIAVGNALGDASFVASVTSSSVEPNVANNQSATKTAIVGVSDLVVTINDAGIATAIAQKENYTLTVINLGPADAHEVQLTVTVPVGVVVNPDPQNCAMTDNVMTCEFGTLALGEQKVFSITALLNAEGNFQFDAAVSANEKDPDTVNNNAKVTTTVNSTGGNSGGSGGVSQSSSKSGGGALGVLSLLALALLFAMRNRFYTCRRFNVR